MRFSIVVHKDPSSDYGVIVPDLPGCFSAGGSLDEAIEQAREAIECHLEGFLIDGQPIPQAHPIEVHQANPDYADGVWAVVEIDLAKLSSKAKRINITLPERLLTIIDQAAAREGESRSGLLARAALEYVERHGESR
ncbi:MAG: type II toxin-antitoxin system HicB family antitoxin [Gammaproteobacteria bacterium]